MKSTTLNNGLEIITDKRNEDFVNIAYMIDKGSMDEPDDKLGIAHLTEHMVFKGTANRDKDQIWEDVSKFGGSMNAYTAENHTAFYCTILKEYWEEALDVLSDIVWNNTLPEEEFDLEKSVVIEELKMYSDEGKHVVLDLLTKTIFPDIENRWNNGGTPETVSEITREDVSEYIENYFIPKNIKIVITGNINHEKVVKFMKEYLQDYEFKNSSVNYRVDTKEIKIANATQSLVGSQSHLVAYLPIKIDNEKDDFMAQMFCDIMGDGFGSRLMEIREKYGYAYTLGCSYIYYPNDVALMYCYVGLNIDNIEKTKELIIENFNKVKEEGITNNEFESNMIGTLSDFKKAEIFCEDNNMDKINQIINEMPYDNKKNLKTLQSITKNDLQTFIDSNVINKIGFVVVEQA